MTAILNLKGCTQKNVVITFADGQVSRGKVDFYTSDLDDPDGCASLSIKENAENNVLIDAYIDEIKDVKIIN